METPRRALRFACAAVLLAVSGCREGDAGDDDPRLGGLSFLAVGDTGKPVEAIDALDPGKAVAKALAFEDERDPIEAIVLLGDNFYPDGLEKDDLKDRLRENLVGPYCRFIELTPRGAGSLREACPEADAKHPVPIFAVLGNHDYGERESPELQRRVVPDYVRSWRMPKDDVGVRELRGGVSLILLDSNRVARTDGDDDDDVVRAIRDSQGPWRVVAAHHPMLRAGRGYDARFAQRMEGIFERAGRSHPSVSRRPRAQPAGVPGARPLAGPPPRRGRRLGRARDLGRGSEPHLRAGLARIRARRLRTQADAAARRDVARRVCTAAACASARSRALGDCSGRNSAHARDGSLNLQSGTCPRFSSAKCDFPHEKRCNSADTTRCNPPGAAREPFRGGCAPPDPGGLRWRRRTS